MIALNFVSKLRFTADQSPEPGDAVVAHVLDIGLGRPRMKRAYCDDDGVWSCAETGETAGATRFAQHGHGLGAG